MAQCYLPYMWVLNYRTKHWRERRTDCRQRAGYYFRSSYCQFQAAHRWESRLTHSSGWACSEYFCPMCLWVGRHLPSFLYFCFKWLKALIQSHSLLTSKCKYSAGPLNSWDIFKPASPLISLKTTQSDLAARGEATTLFGNEREQGLQSILGNIEQTFGGEPLYKSIEDHPFSDGNKRIGCLIFLLYLTLQNTAIKLNESGLVALALLIAESNPQQKDLMVRLIVNLLTD